MAHKPGINSRIPGIPKSTLLKSTTTTNPLSINSTSTSSTSTHTYLRAGRTNLRRSKSLSDFNSLKSKPNLALNKAASTFKRPIKRPALTETNSNAKVAKVLSKEEPAKPSKPVQQKFAPYDYKGRFNHLKEIHEKLKVSFRELKEQHETVADQNEDLLSTCTQLQASNKALQEQNDALSSSFSKLKHEHASAAQTIADLQNKSTQLELELKDKTEKLETATKSLREVTHAHDVVQAKYTISEQQLKETLELNKFMKEELHKQLYEKRRMHNSIQELKGNIRVFCRIRPTLTSEQDKMLYDVNYIDENSLEMYRSKDKKLEFTFDKVFGPNSGQADIFEELSQLVQSALDGYNVCVFAYGQTGSGKTYTMEGESDQDSRGMIPRSIDAIFLALQNMKKMGWTYKIKASFLEIYNEIINDLLDPKNSNLDIKMCDAKGADVYVSNLTVEDIHSPERLKTLMKIAQRNRAVAATENNERSSRSHSVAKITLEGTNEEKGWKCTGNLNLVDLAGSEKFHTNETTRLRETTNINKSLSTLSNVILCLVKKNSHIPYRNSKLTYLLMPSLGGNSKTLMLVNISPLDDCFNESVNSLRFASTVNQCKTGSIRKQKTQS